MIKDKELAQQREIEDAKRRSIEAQSALIQAVSLAISDKDDVPNDIDSIKQIAKEFYQLLQSLTQMPKKESGTIPFAVQIVKSLLSPELTKKPEEEPPVITAGELTKEELYLRVAEKMKWKTTTPVTTFLVNRCKIPEERIEQDPEGCWAEIAQLMGWF